MCVPISCDENVTFSFRPPYTKAIAVESTKSIKIRMPEQSNDYRVVTFGSGGVGKSSLGKKSFPLLLSAYAASNARVENIFCFSSLESRGFGRQREAHARISLRKSLPGKCFIHLIDAKGTAFALIVDLCPSNRLPMCLLNHLLFFFRPPSVLRFIKGTFPTNYIPTIEDTYRQVSASV